MLLYLGIFILSAIVLGIFLWYTRVYKHSVWYNIKLLYKVYDTACQDVKVLKGKQKIVNNISVGTGLCYALYDMPTVDYHNRHAIIDILSKEITLEDLQWKVQYEKISEDALRKMLTYINLGKGTSVYWFPSGDVLSRRDFLYRVLKKYGKIK